MLTVINKKIFLTFENQSKEISLRCTEGVKVEQSIFYESFKFRRFWETNLVAPRAPTCFKVNLCEETISRTDEGQPRPKYIFNKCGTTSTFLLSRGLVHHHHRILNVINMSLKHMGTSNYTNLKFLWLIQHQLICIFSLLR